MTETVCIFCTTKNQKTSRSLPASLFSFLHQLLLFQSNLLNTLPHTNETKPGNIVKENKGNIYRFTHIITTLTQDSLNYPKNLITSLVRLVVRFSSLNPDHKVHCYVETRQALHWTLLDICGWTHVAELPTIWNYRGTFLLFVCQYALNEYFYIYSLISLYRWLSILMGVYQSVISTEYTSVCIWRSFPNEWSQILRPPPDLLALHVTLTPASDACLINTDVSFRWGAASTLNHHIWSGFFSVHIMANPPPPCCCRMALHTLQSGKIGRREPLRSA